VATKASLLSGGQNLEGCTSANDPTCQGGIAAVRAFMRYFTKANTTDSTGNTTTYEPSSMVPYAEMDSLFVHMNQLLGLGVNVLILHFLFGARCFLAEPSILAVSNAEDLFSTLATGLFYMMYAGFPLLQTNSIIAPNNRWIHYAETINYDNSTGLAIMHVYDEKQFASFTAPELSSIEVMLDNIYQTNSRECYGQVAVPWPDIINETVLADKFPPKLPVDTHCWVPVLIYDSNRVGQLEKVVDHLVSSLVFQAPILVVDIQGSAPQWSTPTRVNNHVWVVSYHLTRDMYYHQKITTQGTAIKSVELITRNLTDLPDEVKDEMYAEDISVLSTLASETNEDDPSFGVTSEVPAVVDPITGRNMCTMGECIMGNLFTDAIRNVSGSDVAFLLGSSFGGPGWPAGNVTAKDIWSALPYTNQVCNGVMSGGSLFRLFNYSLSLAFPELKALPVGFDNSTLLQVSGLEIQFDSTRRASPIISMNIWNQTESKMMPIERMQLYSFAADSFLCRVDDYFRAFLTTGLVEPGEEPGALIAWYSSQWALSAYLYHNPLNFTNTPSRLINDPNSTVPSLNPIQNPSDCVEGQTYWAADSLSCQPCPLLLGMTLSTTRVQVTGQRGLNDTLYATFVIINESPQTVRINSKTSTIPEWLTIGADLTSPRSNTTIGYGTNNFTFDSVLEGNSSLVVTVNVDVKREPEEFVEQTLTSFLTFGVSDAKSFPGCVAPNLDMGITARIIPEKQLNQLGSFSAFGFTAAAVIGLSSILLAVWVRCNRKLRVVKAMQPVFLVVLCCGTLIIGMSGIPFGIDDGNSSQKGCDMACMSIPWLLTNGFLITCAAIFAKLWRINRLFNGGRRFRRMEVHEKDVIWPFVIALVLNTIFLITWTVVDPLTFKRMAVPGQSWNSFGECVLNGSVSVVMVSLLAVVNAVGLLATCYQAFKARNISTEFSESKYLGIAMFSWVQILLVGLPVYFLVDDTDNVVKYFILVTIFFLVCISMLVVIFVPIISVQRGEEKSRVHVTGLDSPTTGNGGGTNAYAGVTSTSSSQPPSTGINGPDAAIPPTKDSHHSDPSQGGNERDQETKESQVSNGNGLGGSGTTTTGVSTVSTSTAEISTTPALTPFKEAQNRYRRRAGDPDYLGDLKDLVDFCSASEQRIERVSITANDDYDCYRGPVYRLKGFDGFLYAPQAMSVRLQEELAYSAVSQYCESPHSTNIDLIPPKESEIYNPNERMWELWKQENGFPAVDNSGQPIQINNASESKKRYKSFRKLSWATMGYNYDWTARTYHDHDRSPVPVDLENVAKRFAATSLLYLNSPNTNFTGSACIVNFYNGKSLMGGHRDDSEFAIDKPIVSFSMGRPAVFLLGGPTREDTPIIPILVRPGDVMLMGGASRLNYHAMARLLPHQDIMTSMDQSQLPSPEEQISSLIEDDNHDNEGDTNSCIPTTERDALHKYLQDHRVNINLRQVYCD